MSTYALWCQMLHSPDGWLVWIVTICGVLSIVCAILFVIVLYGVLYEAGEAAPYHDDTQSSASISTSTPE